MEIHHGVDEFRVVARISAVKPRWVWTGTTPKPTPTVTGSAMAKVLGDRLSAESASLKVKE